MSFRNCREAGLWLALSLLSAGVFAAPDDPFAPVPKPTPFQSVLSEPSDQPRPTPVSPSPTGEDHSAHTGHGDHTQHHKAPEHTQKHSHHHGEQAL